MLLKDPINSYLEWQAIFIQKLEQGILFEFWIRRRCLSDTYSVTSNTITTTQIDII